MMLLNGPDDAVRLWWRLTAREESASGRDPFLIKGRVAARRCVACRHERYHKVPKKGGVGWVDRCMRCGTIWNFGIEYVVRGTVQISRRPHGLERRLVRLGDLEHCIDEVPRADAVLYAMYLMTDRSYEFVAALANRLARAQPGELTLPRSGFTVARVRGAVKRGRRALRVALEARSLLARQIPVLMLTGAKEQLEVLEPLPMEVVLPADPVEWSGLLHEFALKPSALNGFSALRSLTRLSRGSTAELGTIYREVPLCDSRP
jgi:hypothetical protein